MKKTIKRIIATILAVATIGSAAVLFTGCCKSDEEKAKDAINDLVSGAENDIGGSSKSDSKQTLSFDLLQHIVDNKEYEVVHDDALNNYVYVAYYLKINPTIEIDGYTFKKTKEESHYNKFLLLSEWELCKDGETLGTFNLGFRYKELASEEKSTGQQTATLVCNNEIKIDKNLTWKENTAELETTYDTP
ncbi:MAG: hypothetical protein UCN61_02755 [Ruminococcus sp.]|nr:hypothetical protein [Ruminococcus sp.]